MLCLFDGRSAEAGLMGLALMPLNMCGKSVAGFK